MGPRRYWSVGENLLWSSVELNAAAALDLWLNSPEHRAIMLNARWLEVGVGAVYARAAPGVYGGRNVTIVTADFDAALFEQLRDDVDADHLAHERRQPDRERAGACADIERALLAGQGQQSAQTLPRRCHAAVMLLPDELSRLTEALPNGT